MLRSLCLAALLAFGAQALPSDIARRQYPGCTHSATARDCWDATTNINTDYATTWPNTGVTVEYWLSLENVTLAPDGYARTMLTFNGTYPGPPIIANWGDLVKIHVTNNLANNGTSIHWHGVRQLNTFQQDGVNGVTQCPLAPGQTLTYTWRATQYGTSWYHSHYAVQYAEGLAGPIIINGPASANYDTDLGAVLLTDWYHNTAFSTWHYAETVGLPQAQNGLINGKNVYGSGGSRWSTTFTPGQKYRLRFINTGVETAFRVSIDDHQFKVIATDFVPITPYTVDSILIGDGQRYDVIVEAKNSSSSNYWLRATVQTACSTGNDNPGNILGIIKYAGGPTTDPTSTGVTIAQNCADEPIASLVPVVPKAVPQVDLSTAQNLFWGLNISPVIRWTLGGVSTRVDWNHPTLQLLESTGTYPTEYNIIELPNNDWYYFVIEEVGVRFAHPIHLHGHDFHILYQGNGTYNATEAALGARWSNPPRRDVAMLPAQGYMVIAFEADNPGIWLLHCHIAWHVSAGFALQFLERKNDITGVDNSTLNDGCSAWSTYQSSATYYQEDSGLKKRELGSDSFM
ncbi:Cupredoxin [Tuber borchii]|uniref:Cupredoxin n=1 Tax=Tuber borchii TaxID=42251 RepID=A0A2T7A2G8_TUBBO|nr:Cupredoxin [Tuber borchii]